MKKFDIKDSPLSGTNLIEASAGTGKTYALSNLYLRLILEKEMMIDDILAVTYTEAATEELRVRIRQRLREAYHAIARDQRHAPDELLDSICLKFKNDKDAHTRLRHAIMNFDEASIFTIHSFCQKMLLENAFESGETFNAELLTDQSGLIQEIVDDFYRINFYNASPLLAQYVTIKKINIDFFTKLIKSRSIDPSFRIIPETGRPDVASLDLRLYKSYKKIKKLWSDKRDEIKKILLNYDGFHRSKYRLDSIKPLLFSMDDYLVLDEPLMIFKNFVKFTAANIAKSMKGGYEPPAHKFFDLCGEFENLNNGLTEAYTVFQKYLKKQLFDYAEKELRRRKKEKNIRSFDDLLENMRRALEKGPDSELAAAVRAKYKAALIDEFQDTDPVQYDIFTTIFSSEESILYLIGDPKQAIYKFRGADIFAYFKASGSIRNSYTLGTNWRSQPDYIEAINTIFSSAEKPFVFKEIPYHAISPPEKYDRGFLYLNGKQEPPVNIWFIEKSYSNEESGLIGKTRAESIVCRHTAAEIARLIILSRQGKALIDDRPVTPNDIAVLVRKNIQARAVQKELKKHGIPSVIYSSESIFESHEAMEIERIVAAIAEPRNESLVKSALVTDIMGLNGNSLFNLINDENQWELILNSFYEYHDIWRQYGFIRMFRHLMTEEDVRRRLLTLPDGERRITNLLHCAELLHRDETEDGLSMEGLLKRLAEKRADIEESFEYQLRLETDDDAVNIITIHRSKGLEFPIVFCPFSWDDSAVKDPGAFTFHDPADNSLTLDIGSESEENIKLSEKENLAENIRLLYVALTRGRHRCYMTWGKIKKSESSAHAYLFHRPHSMDDAGVSFITSKINDMEYDEMLKDLKNLEKKSKGTILISGLPKADLPADTVYKQEKEDLIFRQFAGNVEQTWSVSSFSSLISGIHRADESPDRDSSEITGYIEKSHAQDLNIFTFPAGAKAGTFMHEILEIIDFKEKNLEIINNIITEKISRYGFGNEWCGVISNMIHNVLKAPLSIADPEFILGKIPPDERLSELEFYFPLEKITSKGLADIFTKNKKNRAVSGFAGQAEKLGFRNAGGFVRGFIDLVFKYNDKYYIIDWKSNHLGNNHENYTEDFLKAAMLDNYYILQYHLYATALNQYLELRHPGYNYSRHFGGVYYIFLRGVSPQAGNSTGIYYDLPSPEFINDLSAYLIDKRHRSGS